MVSCARSLRLFLICSAAILFAVATVSGQHGREDDVRRVLEDQRLAWNRGDIDGYMLGYWNHDSTAFVSGGTVTKGYREVTQRYHKRYPDREAMGHLTFEDVVVRFPGREIAVVHGIWRLKRTSDEPWGRFTLILERKPGGWKITHDHTSSGS